MAARLAQKDDSRGRRVEPDAVRVGKDVIELVTSGMYVFPITVYREYIQNAADAIDAARISGLIGPREPGLVSIDIDHETRSVSIRDNGSGIPTVEAIPTLLAIGGSPKRGTGARGFRGVGRLSGLAYCQELEFRTKASGDSSVLSVLWDCKLLRSRLADGSFKGDIRSVISESTEVWYDKSDNIDEHFFKVRMGNVTRHRQDMLLNERMIANYLAQVAPVPFSENFSHANLIDEALSEHTARMPIELAVNGEPVRRLYQDEIKIPGGPYKLAINEIEFIQFADVDGNLGAIGWLGHHDYIRSISSQLGVRGLRARIGDVQIGEASLLDECFKETRFNGWAIGEIHVLDPRIIPNARRDNFELNHHAYNLVTQIGPVAAQIAKRCRTASVARNSALIIRNAIAQIDQRLAEPNPLARAEVSKFLAALHRCQKKLKGLPHADSESLGARLGELADELARSTLTEHGAVVALDEALALVAKYVTNREQARRLSDAIRGIRG